MGIDIFKAVTHLIFDLDGLLIDTETLNFRAVNKVAEKYGKKYLMEDKVKVLGKRGAESTQTVIDLVGLPLTVDEFLKEFDPIFAELVKDVKFMPGAVRIVHHFHKQSIPMAVATSSSAEEFELKTKSLPDLFEPGKYFHHILTAGSDSEIERGKPDPQTFLVCAKRFDPPADPSKILVFEDSGNGVLAALAAGMQVVQVPDPAIIAHNQAKPTLIIDSLENFKPEIFGLPRFDQKIMDAL
ncbi:pseudouridine-5'-phosphatase-like [Brevipalpus obovatus]|uniref:pseudouridine-5'-phosphatase-like n=1 Tax=Brevipalpus obovatus TaxID=246614 RepID=UPI003D9E00AB